MTLADGAAGAAATRHAAPVVEARGVTKRYGPTTALDDADIVIEPGQTHALVGRNGAGKSTLVAILTGLQRADAGELLFGGEPAPPHSGDRAAWRRRSRACTRSRRSSPTLSVAENLFLNRQAALGPDLLAPAAPTGAASCSTPTSWTSARRGMAGDLDVEQRQLVEIARALSLGARFVILDEPTAQLDGQAIERLFDRMRALRESAA